MDKKDTPRKGRTLKRQRGIDDESDAFNLNNSRHRDVSPDIDLSDLASGYSPDVEESLANLFKGKFEEKSPASKLSSSFGFVGLNETNLMKRPKLSTKGRRSIGLTSEERDRKDRMRRSLDYSIERPERPERPESRQALNNTWGDSNDTHYRPKHKRRSVSRSPHKK